MATRNPFARNKRHAITPDELGGFADGGLAIIGEDGSPIHVTRARVASSLRYFLARVELHSSGGLPARLAMTSALVGEGVTFITRSLASVVAYDTESTVVVVDVNWLRPPARKADEPAAPVPFGLADAVEDGVHVDDIIIPTTNPRLCMVAAGAVPVARRPTLAGSRALEAVFNELEDRFDYMLLDLPPVLATSEAMNISQLADSYVLVVRQGATSTSQVDAALEEMQGADVLGVILNRFESDIPNRLRRLVGT